VSTHTHHSGQGRSRDARQHAGSGTTDQGNDPGRPLAEARKNVNDVLRVLYQHRWVFFVPCCAVATIIFVMSLQYPRTYTATTVFERRDDPIMLNVKTSEGTGSFSYWRATMQDDLVSLPIMTEVADNLGLTDALPRGEDGEFTEAALKRRESIAGSLSSSVGIHTRMPNKHIDRVTITYNGPDSEFGKKVIEGVKNAYVRQAGVKIRSFLDDQRAYFAAKANGALEELKTARTDRTELRLANPLINPIVPSEINTRIAQVEVERQMLSLRIKDLKAELAGQKELFALKELDRAPPASTIYPSDGPTITKAPYTPETLRLMGEIRRIQDEIASLKSSRGMTDEHPTIKEMATRCRWYQERFTQQRTSDSDNAGVANKSMGILAPGTSAHEIAAPQTTRSAADLIALLGEQLRIAGLEDNVSEAEQRLRASKDQAARLIEAKENLPTYQEASAAIEERILAAHNVYKANSDTVRLLEPAIAANTQGKLMEFIDVHPARGGAKATSPKSKAILLMAALAGLGVGVFFVILAELFDHIFRSSNHVAQSLGLPILETIDEIITTVDKRKLFVRKVVVVPLVVIITLSITGTTGGLAYLSLEHPSTYERVRNISDKALSILSGEDEAETEMQASL